LEVKRNCGWLGIEPSAARPIAWSGGGVAAERCPVSTSAGVEAWVELYALWQAGLTMRGLSARDSDALAVLRAEQERQKEE
jgi:uncharacterized protein YmfQ (DUF2313 family)